MMGINSDFLQVVHVRYLNGNFVQEEILPVDEYLKSEIYNSAGIPFEVAEPKVPESMITQDEVQNIGLINGSIANVVETARKVSKPVLLTGGNCCYATGVIGGLQLAHGSQARIGLVWFDAHGDFNTKNTTLSGMLGGMPVAVISGLTHPDWRELSQIQSPIPTNRIILVDVRNLDPAEKVFINATDTIIASVGQGFPGKDLHTSIRHLSNKCEYIYLHIDSDILDESYTPNHKTKEPNGPNLDQVKNAIDTVMATKKVVVFAVVSVYGDGEGSDIMITSGKELIQSGLKSWKKYRPA